MDNLHKHTYAFPSYPSAHGSASSAAMTVLSNTLGTKLGTKIGEYANNNFLKPLNIPEQ
jgi:hypothetical protein